MIPLFGLRDVVSIVRQKDVSDGAGGVVPGDLGVVYAKRKCRITVMTDEDEIEGFGHASGDHWRVIMEISLNILKSDFVRVPWGVFPNVVGFFGMPDKFSPTLVIQTPDGAKTLNWVVDASTPANSGYFDSESEYSLVWTGSVWRFTDTPDSLEYDFTGYEQHHNVANLTWSTLVGEDYAVTSKTGPTKDYRIVLVKHQRDHRNVNHHTSLVIELEDGPTP